MFVCHLYVVFFGEMSGLLFFFFLDWVAWFFFDIGLHELLLGCMILEINLLSVALFAIIFSHSECCLFILFMVSFAVQKLLSLIRSQLLIFVFVFITLAGGSKKILVLMSKECSACVSSKSFIVTISV